MKSIIVAAGLGERLRPITDSVPKCMVKYESKCIIDYILDTMENLGINQNIVVNGYKKEVLENHLQNRDIKFYTNESYDTTNMVSTLFTAESEMDDDIIISYADIIYKPKVLQKLIDSPAEISCVVDNKWRELWEQRMDNPLDDAETMKTDSNSLIVELGKKPVSYDDINGQYIGLIKFSKNAINSAKKYYHSLDKNAIYDGKTFDNMYMTSFLQMIIDNLMPITAVHIDGGWLEVDAKEDLTCKMV
jgi:choline kinase